MDVMSLCKSSVALQMKSVYIPDILEKSSSLHDILHYLLPCPPKDSVLIYFITYTPSG